MSCRTTAYGSAFTSIHRLESGLSDVQTLSAYHALRSEGRQLGDTISAPEQATWENYVDRQIELLDSRGFSEARVRSLRARLNDARSELPDAASWHALTNLHNRTHAQARTIQAEVAEFARRTGSTAEEAATEYNRILSSVPRGRSVTAPEGYGEYNSPHGSVPRDQGTVIALQRLREAADLAEAERNAEGGRRIERRNINSTAIAEAGYDPADGRLEVVFHRQGNRSEPYYYHSVPEEVWERMLTESAGGVYQSEIRNHSEYRYASQEEAEAAGYRRRCGNCGQFLGDGHTCPEGANADNPAAIAEALSPNTVEGAAVPAPASPETAAEPAGESFGISARDQLMLDREDRIRARDQRENEEMRRMQGMTPEQRQAYFLQTMAEAETSGAGDPDGLDASDVNADEAVDAEMARESERATEAAEAPARPEPVEASTLLLERASDGIRDEVFQEAFPSVGHRQSYGNYEGPRVEDLRMFATRTPVTAPVALTISEYNDPENVYRRTHSRLTADTETYRNSDGEWEVQVRNPRCDCDVYVRNSDCEHVRNGGEAIRRHITPSDPSRVVDLSQVDEERPPPRTPSAVGINSNWRWSHRRRRGATGNARYDSFTTPPLTQLRRAAASNPIIFDAAVNGYSDDGGGIRASGHFTVNGTATVYRPRPGEWEVRLSNPDCYCTAFRNNGTCPHVAQAEERLRTYIEPSTGGGGGSRTMSEAEIAAVARQAEEAAARDWTRAEETRAAAAARWTGGAPEDSYANNFDAFKADYDAALERKAAGENAIEYKTENVLGGQFTRESGRGFGMEIEFDIKRGVDRSTALRNIARELYEAGLTPVDYQQGYHASRYRGYVDTQARGYSFEQDCTVAGEIVAPICYDEPETWENYRKICEILDRNGAVASTRTGAHVHIGTPSMTAGTATELMRTVNQHEDVIYRVSSNANKQHRGMRWCGPSREVPMSGYSDINEARRYHSSHGYNMNFESVNGRSSDHVEFRMWDGTLDPAMMQQQVKLSAQMTLAAERNAANPDLSPVAREPRGSHATREAGMRGNDRRRALTDDEMAETTATFRSFVDTLTDNREDKKGYAALFAITKWSSGN